MKRSLMTVVILLLVGCQYTPKTIPDNLPRAETKYAGVLAIVTATTAEDFKVQRYMQKYPPPATAKPTKENLSTLARNYIVDSVRNTLNASGLFAGFGSYSYFMIVEILECNTYNGFESDQALIRIRYKLLKEGGVLFEDTIQSYVWMEEFVYAGQVRFAKTFEKLMTDNVMQLVTSMEKS